jgi:hypothetical protein
VAIINPYIARTDSGKRAWFSLCRVQEGKRKKGGLSLSVISFLSCLSSVNKRTLASTITNSTGSNACSREVAVVLGHVVGEGDELVGVAPLVVVPGDHLAELGVQGDAGVGVEDRGAGVANEIGGDNLVFGVTEDALEAAFGSFLHLLANFFVGGVLLELAGQVDDGNVGGGHAEGHTSELAVQLGDDFADSLGSAGCAGDHVGTGGTASAPVLAALGWTVDGELVDGDGVHGGHKTLSNAEIIVQNLGDGGQAVGGA